MFVSIQKVRKGDTIRETYLDAKRQLRVEKGPGTKVTKVEHDVCSKRGTHINSRECFDFGTLVWRTVEVEVEETDETRDYALYDMALSTTGLGEILTVDGQAYLNAENARTDPAKQLLVEIFSDPERLDGALHTLIDKADNGLVSVNDVRQSAGLSPL